MAIRQLQNRVKKLSPNEKRIITLTWEKQDVPKDYDPEKDILLFIDLCGWSKKRYGKEN